MLVCLEHLGCLVVGFWGSFHLLKSVFGGLIYAMSGHVNGSNECSLCALTLGPLTCMFA